MGWRAIDQKTAKAAIVTSRRAGETLIKASEAAGVHVATVCRWMNTDTRFSVAIRKAEEAIRKEEMAQAQERFAEYLAEREAAEAEWRARQVFLERLRKTCVPVHPRCPVCDSLSETRRAFRFITFWRCSWYPWCEWASWRPRYPQDCPECYGPRFWSSSRLSVSCARCKARNRIEWGEGECE
jgi:primosomal protein N'